MQGSSQIVPANKPPTPSCLQAGCPSCPPTNNVRALKGIVSVFHAIFLRYHCVSLKYHIQVGCKSLKPVDSTRRLNHCSHLPTMSTTMTNVADNKKFCRRPVGQNTPSERARRLGVADHPRLFLCLLPRLIDVL